MHHHARTIIREVAAALAVFSLYILVLLAPLHQAAGLQRDLDALGYSALDLWSVCQPLTVDGSKDQPGIAKCPVTGIAKHELALADPPSIDLAAPSLSAHVLYPPAAPLSHRARAPFVAQARAPPATV